MNTFLRIVFIVLFLLCASEPLFSQTIFINFNERFIPMVPEDLGRIERIHLPHPSAEQLSLSPLQFFRVNETGLLNAYLLVKETKPLQRMAYRRNLTFIPDDSRAVFKVLYNPPYVDEKQIIRQAWEKVFGFDVWRPYYEYKKVERWVKERMSFKVFSLKCKPSFQKDSAVYTCKSCF